MNRREFFKTLLFGVGAVSLPPSTPTDTLPAVIHLGIGPYLDVGKHMRQVVAERVEVEYMKGTLHGTL